MKLQIDPVVEAKYTKQVDTDLDWLTWDMIRGTNPADTGLESHIRISENLMGPFPAGGPSGSTIGWLSSDSAHLSTTGVVNRPDGSGKGQDVDVTLSAVVVAGPITKVKMFMVRIAKDGLNDVEIIENDSEWLTWSVIRLSNIAAEQTGSDLYLPTSGPFGSVISWESSDEAVVAIDGTVTRSMRKNIPVNLTATMTIGEETTTLRFYVVVSKLEAADLTDEQAVAADAQWLRWVTIRRENTNQTDVIHDLNLPREGKKGSHITWDCSNESVIYTNLELLGVVTRPAHILGDMSVQLTATITRGTESTTKVFDLTILRIDGPEDSEIVTEDYNWLTWDTIKGMNVSKTDVKVDLGLPVFGPNGSTVTWESSDISHVTNDGVITRPAVIDNSINVALTATITYRETTATKEFIVGITKMDLSELPHEEVLAMDATWLTWTIIAGANADITDITEPLNLPTLAPNGSTITWTSDNEAVITNDGIVTKPAYEELDDATVTLVAALRYNSADDIKAFVLTVIRSETPSIDPDVEIVAAAKAWLDFNVIAGTNSAITDITDNLNFVPTSFNGATIEWQSDTIATIADDGEVNRPAYGSGDATVTVQATITSGLVSDFVVFTFTVLELEI